jgi:CubicO group peptidase (beta-lactamase class C family)
MWSSRMVARVAKSGAVGGWLLSACHAGPAGPAAQAVAPAADRPASPAAAEIGRRIHTVVGRLQDVPGLAVAVVRDSAIVYLGAAGSRDREAGLAATPATPYYLASSTKSFTAMAASVLATRGTIDLDAPLSRYLPDARLPPARPADSVTFRQLLTHTMGLKNDAIVIHTAYTGDHRPGELLALLSRSEVIDRAFHYDNLGYVIASLALERATGRPWQRVLESTVFQPLSLTRTTAYMSQAERWDLAVPYWAGAEASPRRLARTKTDATMHAAGGVVSTADDLARWLVANINDGRVDGAQVLPAAAVRESHRLQVVLPTEVPFGAFRRFGYGLGWYWGTYDGDTVLHHFGGYAGARAHVSFMPSRRVGVAVLLNASGPAADVADLVATAVYDVMLGKPDRAARFDSLLLRAARELDHAKAGWARQQREIAARPSTLAHPLASYAGEYRSGALGRMRVHQAGDRLRLSLGPLDAVAGFYTRPEAVRLEFEPGSGDVIQFFPGRERADSLTYAGYVFRRVP